MNYIDNDQENSDYQIEGQLSLDDYILDNGFKPIESPVIAVSKVFARCIKQMSLPEWKTFIFALRHIEWSKTNNRRKVHLDKWKLISILGLKANETDISSHLKRAIGDLPKNSFVSFEDRDKGYWDNGCFVTRIRCYRDYVLVVFEDEYMRLFEGLDKDNPFITMWSEDLFKLTSERSVLLYEHLRLHSDTRVTNTRIISTRDFKTLFGIPKDGKGSYMKSNGHFDRNQFERKVIQPACNDLMKCKMIHLYINEDGLPYRKIKAHGRVIGYELTWDISEHPGIANAKEVAEIRKLDPKEIKIARDLAKGKKKPKHISSSKQAFANYEQGEKVDYEALLAQIDEDKE